MKFTTLILLLALCLVATVASKRMGALEMWKSQGPSDVSENVNFLIVLKQQNLDKLENIVNEVSNPDSSRYTQYLTKDEVLDLVAPALEVSEKISAFYTNLCPSAHIINQRDNLKVRCPISCLKTAFGLSLEKFGLASNANITVNRVHPARSIAKFPVEIAEYIDFLSGLNLLPEVRKKHEVKPISNPTASYGYVIPQTIRRIYGVPAGAKTTNKRSSQSVIEFSPVGAPLLTDLKQFDDLSGELFTNVSKIIGPFDQGQADGESTLDLQYLAALGASAETWYITLTEGWILEAANVVFNTPEPPLVNSVSYGWPEELTCSSVTGANCTDATVSQYIARSNSEIAKLAAIGVSMLIASQDEGAPSEQNMYCSLDNTHPLWPIYPSSSPWVTAVSGTTLVPISGTTVFDNVVFDTDSASPPICSRGYPCDTTSTFQYPCMPNNTEYSWTTGGGFSKYANAQTYQTAAIQNYLNSKSLIPPKQFFADGNRGYPDVSAVGDRILIIQNGAIGVTAGTSAATPIFSGLVTLLNDARLNAGKKPLGFLNPLFYKMASAAPKTFTVIKEGNNKGTIQSVCKYGYGCNENGWSPVTGLGVPAYPEMLKYVLSLP